MGTLEEKSKSDEEIKRERIIRGIENWAIPLGFAAAVGTLEYFTGAVGQFAAVYNGIPFEEAIKHGHSYNIVSSLFAAGIGSLPGFCLLGLRELFDM